MSTVVFDYEEFLISFPHIAQAVTEGKLNETVITTQYEQVASWLGDSDENSPYPYNPEKNILCRKTVLYLATCHWLTLDLWGNGQGGRIASASQGSVSTSFDLFKPNSENGQWWAQTPCGQKYWKITAPYRLGGKLYVHKEAHPWH